MKSDPGLLAELNADGRAVMARAMGRSPNAIKIGPDYFAVVDLADAVRTWNACLKSNGWGGSEAPKVTCCIDGKLYRISYNGRVWDAGTNAEVKIGDRKTCAELDAEGWKQ